MQKLWTMTLNDLRTVFLDRSIWINLVFIPIALVFVVGAATDALSSGEEPAIIERSQIDVLNLDNGELGSALLTALRDEAALRVCPADCDLTGPLTEALAIGRLRDGQTEAFITIPANFTMDARAGNSVRILYQTTGGGLPATTSLTQSAVQNAVQQISGAVVAERVGLDVAMQLGSVTVDGQSVVVMKLSTDTERINFRETIYQKAVDIWAGTPASIDYQQTQADNATSGINGFAQSVPGMGTMYVLFNVLAGMSNLIVERKQWTLQRLAVMPVAKWQILGGKMLARFLLGMIQYGVVFGVGLLLGLSYANLPGLLLVMVAFAASATALSFALATFVTTEQQASSLSLLLGLTLAPIGGAWWPLEIVPPWMQTAALFSPVGWAMRGFSELLFHGGSVATVLVPVGVLLAISAVLFGVAVTRFRYA